MRGIFWALVLINVCAGGWFWWAAQQDSASDVEASVKVSVRVSNASVREGEHPALVLLEELNAAKLKEMVQAKERLRLEAVAQGQIDAAAEEGRQLCTLVGAFPESRKAEYFVEHLRALDITGAVQEMEVPGESSFWVYLPAEVSKKKALRLLHELQAKKIDSYVIPKGDLANGISLGLFSSEEAALRRQDEVAGHGYSAAVEEVERTYEEVWVVLAAAEAEKVDENLWKKLLKKQENLELRQNFCPDVASD